MVQCNDFFPAWLEKEMRLAACNKGFLALVAGYGLCRCASGLSFQMIEPYGQSAIADAGKIFGMATLVACAYVGDRAHGKFWLLVFPSLVASCGCVLLFDTASSPMPSLPALSLGVFLFGFGTAAMMLQWLEFVGTMPLKQIILIIGTAEAFNSLITIAIGTPTSPARLLPLLVGTSFILMLVYRRMAEQGSVPSLSTARRDAFEPSRIISLRLIIWVSVYCFSYGAIIALMGFQKLSAFDNFGNIIPGAVIAAFAVFLSSRFDIRMLQNIAFAFMVSGLIIIGFLDGENAWVQVFAGTGAASCRLFAYSLACMRARVSHTSALPACALVKVLIIMMMEAGASVGSFPLNIDKTILVAVIILTMILLSAFLSPFNIDEQRILERAAKSSPESQRKEALVDLCADKALSKRESTVFILMANGEDIAAISDELFISKSAVRAHVSRIYAKFNVHNRQEFNAALAHMLPPSSSHDEHD